MYFEEGPLKGEPKGLKVVCEERFGVDVVKGEKHDALVARLKAEEDFRSIETRIELRIAQKLIIKGNGLGTRVGILWRVVAG